MFYLARTNISKEDTTHILNPYVYMNLLSSGNHTVKYYLTIQYNIGL